MNRRAQLTWICSNVGFGTEIHVGCMWCCSHFHHCDHHNCILHHNDAVHVCIDHHCSGTRIQNIHVEHSLPHQSDHHNHCHSHNASGQECTCTLQHYTVIKFSNRRSLFTSINWIQIKWEPSLVKFHIYWILFMISVEAQSKYFSVPGFDLVNISHTKQPTCYSCTWSRWDHRCGNQMNYRKTVHPLHLNSPGLHHTAMIWEYSGLSGTCQHHRQSNFKQIILITCNKKKLFPIQAGFKIPVHFFSTYLFVTPTWNDLLDISYPCSSGSHLSYLHNHCLHHTPKLMEYTSCFYKSTARKTSILKTMSNLKRVNLLISQKLWMKISPTFEVLQTAHNQITVFSDIRLSILVHRYLLSPFSG